MTGNASVCLPAKAPAFALRGAPGWQRPEPSLTLARGTGCRALSLRFRKDMERNLRVVEVPSGARVLRRRANKGDAGDAAVKVLHLEFCRAVAWGLRLPQSIRARAVGWLACRFCRNGRVGDSRE